MYTKSSVRELFSRNTSYAKHATPILSNPYSIDFKSGL